MTSKYVKMRQKYRSTCWKWSRINTARLARNGLRLLGTQKQVDADTSRAARLILEWAGGSRVSIARGTERTFLGIRATSRLGWEQPRMRAIQGKKNGV